LPEVLLAVALRNRISRTQRGSMQVTDAGQNSLTFSESAIA
jgi:hypothetical protein